MSLLKVGIEKSNILVYVAKEERTNENIGENFFCNFALVIFGYSSHLGIIFNKDNINI